MDVIDGIRHVLGDALEVGALAESFDRSTLLFGTLPEFDSMTVVTVVLGLEERFGIEIDGEEIDAETFASVGSLAEFVESKLAVSG